MHGARRPLLQAKGSQAPEPVHPKEEGARALWLLGSTGVPPVVARVPREHRTSRCNLRLALQSLAT
jgi:hypothetical protein